MRQRARVIFLIVSRFSFLMMLPRFYSTPTKVNCLFRYSVTGLLFLLALLAPCLAAAQPVPGGGDRDEGVYALPIGNPTIVWAAPSTSAREIARLDSASVPLKSIDVVDAEGKTFEKVEPRAGAGVSWSVGYVLSDQIQVNRKRPRQYGGGFYGSLAFASAEPSVLSIEGSPVAQSPFGEERAAMYSIGITAGTGQYIPPGATDLWYRFDIEYSLLESSADATPDVEEASAQMLRIGLGSDLIYQASPSIDLYIGALAGGGPVTNKLTFANGEDLTAVGIFGTLDALVGVGFGRNTARETGISRSSLRLRLEGGYRLGQRLGEWSYSSYDEDLDGSFEAANSDDVLSLNGPVLRLVVGLR